MLYNQYLSLRYYPSCRTLTLFTLSVKTTVHCGKTGTRYVDHDHLDNLLYSQPFLIK